VQNAFTHFGKAAGLSQVMA